MRKILWSVYEFADDHIVGCLSVFCLALAVVTSQLGTLSPTNCSFNQYHGLITASCDVEMGVWWKVKVGTSEVVSMTEDGTEWLDPVTGKGTFLSGYEAQYREKQISELLQSHARP